MVYPLAMLLARVLDRQRRVHHRRPRGGAVRPAPDPRVLATACCSRSWSGAPGRRSAFCSRSPQRAAACRAALLTAIDVAVLLPLVSPPFTTAIAMIFSFGPRGLITYDLLGLKGVTVYGLTSTLFSEALTFFPIAYLTLRPLLAAIDSNVEGMAFSLGASRWRVFRTVTLPLTHSGLANAFLLLFAASLADFATPLILAGNQFPVLPTQAYPADHGAVRSARRRRIVVRAASACARGLPAAALLGEPALST